MCRLEAADFLLTIREKRRSWPAVSNLCLMQPQEGSFRDCVDVSRKWYTSMNLLLLLCYLTISEVETGLNNLTWWMFLNE